MTQALALVFRYSIKGTDSVPLREELKIIESYIDIQKNRSRSVAALFLRSRKLQACGSAPLETENAMPRRRSRSLDGHADQAGILFAAANAPLTFQRTLMPRGTMDQALVTGLSAAANHALISLVQESIQAAALVVVGPGRRARRRRRAVEPRDDRRRPGRDRRGHRRAARVRASRHREPLPRGGAPAGSGSRSPGTAGRDRRRPARGVVDRRGKRGRSFAVQRAAAAALAGGNTLARPPARPLDADLPPEETQASLAKSLGIGLGVVAGMSAFGVGERKLADVVSQALARVLPGRRRVLAPGRARRRARRLRRGRALHRGHADCTASRTCRSRCEAAFDIPPPNPSSSGSYESLVAVRHARPAPAAATCGRRPRPS